jgi:multicomponent Na+:H+ antiporter subunit E
VNVSQLSVLIKRLVTFAFLWWVLTGGSIENWPLAILIIVTSAAISAALAPAASWSIRGLAAFLPFFLWYSVKGGIDVALRTFRRTLPINPEMVSYPLRLRREPACLFFANTINLLPGTLCAEIQGDELIVHLLDNGGGFERELKALEHKVARLYKIPLMSDSGEQHATF